MKKMIFLILCSVWLLAEHNYTNALIKENSPYLQQHAHNPVHWFPWGEEAFEKAKKANKLIFLSIGYSTCHWCHVMEEESFTDVDVAKLLNDDFIAIKVDREQYPQIDAKYQALYRAVYGERGGWPLSVFLSPDREGFFIGTYIPKEEGYGSKGLENLLPSFVKLQNNKEAFYTAIDKHKKVKNYTALKSKLTTKIMDRVVSDIENQFDSINGGFAKHPKFPEASKLQLLLDIYNLSDNQQAENMAMKTLNKMAKGGIYDQIDGGFFRYTLDPEWQIPHFEKMLYTNAELISVYVKAHGMLGKGFARFFYEKVVGETIAQMEKHYMQEGMYLSASDADSNGEEGGYFIYEYIEIKSALKDKGWKPKEIENALAYMGIEQDGNIDGDFSQTHITSQLKPFICWSKPYKTEELKEYLKSVRSRRTFPFVDKKINTAWNAMMIKALFEASKVDKNYLALGKERLAALLTLMYPNATLYHQTLLGKKPKQKAILEDYAFLVDALIVGYERTYNQKYLTLAQRFTDDALGKFYRNKRWYLSDDGLEAYADFDDRYYTSALSVMLENLVRMSILTEVLKYNAIAKETITGSAGILDENPALAPKLVDVFLRLKKGDIIIHASKEKLLSVQWEIDNIEYPYILSAVEESAEYLACKGTMCFAHDKNITVLIEKINKAVN